jgi:predicted RNA binding protein YcfA (HicA-like mRNA interferase family)
VGKLPTLKPREVVALLESLGFGEVRQKGAHKQFRHPDGRGTTVPFHAGRDISPTLLRKIAKDIGPTAEQFLGRGDVAAEQRDEADER